MAMGEYVGVVRTLAKANIGLVLLAAGQSKRYGKSNKLFEPFAGTVLIDWVLGSLSSYGLGDKYILLPENTADEFTELSGFVEASSFKLEKIKEGQPMLYTLACAAELARDRRWDAMTVFLADMPFVDVRVPEQMIAKRRPSPIEDVLLRPMDRDGRPSHPVVLGRRYFSEIIEKKSSLDGLNGTSQRESEDDKGCRFLFSKYKQRTQLFSGLLSTWSGHDVDTPTDLHHARNIFARSGLIRDEQQQ